MQDLLIALYAALIGSMLFFAFAVAPTVFRSLPAEHAGAFLRRLFPRYYLWGLVLALAGTLAAIATDAGPIVIGIAAVVLLLFVYARQFLMPAINRTRDRELEGDTAAGSRFRALHLQSVLINGVQLVLLLVAAALVSMQV